MEEERGVSVVVGAIVLIMIGVIAFAVYYPRYANTQIRSVEEEHMKEVRGRFTDLKEKIEALPVGGSDTIHVPGDSDSVAFVPQPGMGSRISVNSLRVRSVEIRPSDDAFGIENENLSDNVYGMREYLLVQSEVDNDARSFLKFSLENVQPGSRILRAELRLYCGESVRNVKNVTDVRILPVGNDSWTENTLTWRTMPTLGDPQDEVYVNKTGWVSLTAKDFVVEELGGDGTVSLGLRVRQEDYDGVRRYLEFSSKEGSRSPYLEVDYLVSSGSWNQSDWSGAETQPELEAGKWSDSYDNYYSGTDVSTDGEVTLQGGSLSGELVSSVYDAGSSVDWYTIAWNADTPSTVAGENNSVDSEPDPLVDGTSRVGERLSPLSGAQNQDGTYEEIREENVTSDEYVPVGAQENFEGGVGSLEDARSDDGTYENVWEKNYYTVYYRHRSSDSEVLSMGTGVVGNNASTFVDGDGDVRAIDEERWGFWALLDVRYAFSLPGGVSKSDVFGLTFETDSWWTDVPMENCYLEAYDYNNGEYDQIDVLPDSENLRSIPLDPDNYVSTDGAMEVRYSQPTFGFFEPLGRLHIDFHQMEIELHDPNYRFDVGQDISDVPTADTYELQLEYYTAGDSENVELRLYDFSTGTYEPIENLAGGTEASPNTFTYDLTGTDYLSNGNVRVRYVQPDNDATQTSLMVDYCRVHAHRSGNYLNWEHRIEGVEAGYDDYTLLFRGYTSGDLEEVGLYVWNSNDGSWTFVGDLPRGSPGWISYNLPENVNNYLVGGDFSVGYMDYGGDDTETTINVDYCALEGTSTAYTDVKVYTRTGSTENAYDGTWSGWSSATNGEEIQSPNNQYIQYRVELSSEDETVTPAFRRVSLSYLGAGTENSSSGTVSFRPYNLVYPDQTYVYEEDAVIMLQEGKNLMISHPSLISTSEASGDLIEVRVHRFIISGVSSSISTTGSAGIEVTKLSSREVVAPLEGPNREEVVLEVSSDYRNSWRDYLEEEEKKLDAKGYNASLDGLTLTIRGKNTGGGKDIYYYETLTELEVTVS